MPKLKDEHKTFLIVQFAQDRSITEIRDLFREAYDFVLTTGQISYYNPKYGTDLSHKWREMYQNVRAEWFSRIGECPGAHLSVRVSRLWEMAEDARRKGNVALAADLYRQIAQDAGGMFSRAAVTQNAQIRMQNTVSQARVAFESPEEELKGRELVAKLLNMKVEELPPPSGCHRGTGGG